VRPAIFEKYPMPSYEFSCQTCGRTFERSLPMGADQAGVRCPAGHRQVRRIYSAAPVFFKGSGFYVTDHRSGTGQEPGSQS
jgi:putative FmdB family regulatory protein